MYIINISFIVSAPIHGAWYDFVTSKFIPAVKSDERVIKTLFSRVLSQEIEQQFTYSLQIDVEQISYYTQLKGSVLAEYQQFSSELFDAEVTHYISILKVLQ